MKAKQTIALIVLGVVAVGVLFAVFGSGGLMLSPAFREDVDNSGQVNINDVNVIKSCWFKNVTLNPECKNADVNRDGVINIIDASLIKSKWFANIISCSDSDGVNTSIKGYVNEVWSGNNQTFTAWDECINSNTVYELSCSNGATKPSNATLMSCGSGKICSNGACVEETPTCIDTDGGNNPGEFGTTTFEYGSFQAVRNDSCVIVGYSELILINETGYYWDGVNTCTSPVSQLNASVGDCSISSSIEVYSCDNSDCYVDEKFCGYDEFGNLVDADADEFIECVNGCSAGACINITG